jgi:hypothetical protein
MFCIFPGTFFSKILIFNRQIDSYGSVGIYSAGHIPRVIIGANYTITYHEAIVLTPMRSEAPNKQGPTELIREFLFFFVLVFGLNHIAFSQPIMEIRSPQHINENLASVIFAYVDPAKNNWEVDQLPPPKELFHPQSQVDFRGAKRGVAWLNVRLVNRTNEELRLFLYSDTAFFPIHIYAKDQHALRLLGGVDPSLDLQSDMHLGSIHVPLILEAQAEREIYIKFRRSASSSSYNFILASSYAYESYASMDIAMRHLFLGYTLAVFFYNLFFWWKLARLEYLTYTLYLFGFGFTNAVFSLQLSALTPALWIREYHWYMHAIGSDLTFAFAGLFAIFFLKLRTKQPVFFKVFSIFIAAFIINMFVSVYSVDVGTDLRSLLGTSFGLIFLLAGFRAIKSGFRPARYFCAGWGILILCNFIYVIYQIGNFPRSFFLDWIMPIGASIPYSHEKNPS